MGFKTVFPVLICLAVGFGTAMSQDDHSSSSENTSRELLEPQVFILEGKVSSDNSHPYMVAITQERVTLIKDFLCGGSLISQRTVLTAAHCMALTSKKDGTLRKSLRVVVGTNKWETEGTRYKIERSVIHSHYDATNIFNDIALLITVTKVELSNSVQLIALNYDYIGAGVNTTVAGWGLTSVTGGYSRVLREITLLTISNEQCLEAFKNIDPNEVTNIYPVNTDVEICTYHSVGHGTCVHDSGSPMVRTDDDEQIGIVSWGYPCAKGYPDVFTRLSVYKDFIESNIVE